MVVQQKILSRKESLKWFRHFFAGLLPFFRSINIEFLFPSTRSTFMSTTYLSTEQTIYFRCSRSESNLNLFIGHARQHLTPNSRRRESRCAPGSTHTISYRGQERSQHHDKDQMIYLISIKERLVENVTHNPTPSSSFASLPACHSYDDNIPLDQPVGVYNVLLPAGLVLLAKDRVLIDVLGVGSRPEARRVLTVGPAHRMGHHANKGRSTQRKRAYSINSLRRNASISLHGGRRSGRSCVPAAWKDEWMNPMLCVATTGLQPTL